MLLTVTVMVAVSPVVKLVLAGLVFQLRVQVGGGSPPPPFGWQQIPPEQVPDPSMYPTSPQFPMPVTQVPVVQPPDRSWQFESHVVPSGGSQPSPLSTIPLPQTGGEGGGGFEKVHEPDFRQIPTIVSQIPLASQAVTG